MAGWFGISFLHVSLAKPFYACWVITGMVRADDVDTCLRCLAQILPFIYVKVCLPINTASGEISFFGWKIESTHGSWKLRFVSFVARHGHKQIAASILRNINGWEWMVEGTSTLNRKSQNQDQLQPSKPSNPSKLHSSPLSPFPFPLTPPPKKNQTFIFMFCKKIPRFHENGGSKGCIQDMLYGCHLLGQARCHSNGPTTRADAARYRGLDLEAIFRIRQQIIQPWRKLWGFGGSGGLGPGG